MPAKIPQFGDFVFGEGTGIYNARMREMAPAERDLTILGRAGAHGMSIVNSRRKGKTVMISGVIIKDSSSELITAIRDMEKMLMAESSGGLPTADLQFQNEDGTWIYDDAVLLNPETLFPDEEANNVSWMPFTAVFFCPTGIARSISLTTVDFDSITSTPNTDSITISGSVGPHVLIAITFNTVSTITEFTFTNTTTSEQITVDGLSITNGDTVYIDNENQEVRVNTTKVAFDGVFPTFIPDLNEWQLAVAGSSNIAEQQTTYDDVEQVYGNNWISQEFQVDSNLDIAQIALYLRKVQGEVLQLYADFTSSVPSTHFNKSGSVTVDSGRAKLDAIGQTSTMDTNGKSPTGYPSGDDITGCEFYFNWVGGGPEGTDRRFGITNGTDYIRLKTEHVTGTSRWETGGAFSGGGGGLSATSGTFKVIVESGAVKVYFNGAYQFTAKSSGGMPAGMYFWAQAPQISGTTNYLLIDNVKFTAIANANQDVDVAIYSDSAGDPDAVISNGSLTIAESDVATSFSQILKAFSTAPSLTTATVYHLVIKQDGGDENNYYEVRKNTAGGYASGTLEKSADGGSTWDDTTPAAEDLWFKLWTTLPTSFDIDIAMSYYESHYGVV